MPRVIIDCSGVEAFRSVDRGVAHFSLTTQPAPSGIHSIKIHSIKLVTAVGKKHPLYKKQKTQKSIPIEELLQYDFISPQREFYGRQQNVRSFDGWRDDLYPRKISYQAESLSLYENLVESGKAVAYIPKFYADQIGAHVLNVSGCDEECEFDIYLSSKRQDQIMWLNDLIEDIHEKKLFF